MGFEFDAPLIKASWALGDGTAFVTREKSLILLYWIAFIDLGMFVESSFFKPMFVGIWVMRY